MRSTENEIQTGFLRLKQRRPISRQTQTLTTYWLCLVNVPALISVCAWVYANVNSEIILCRLLRPRNVGTSLSFHRYRSPGTRTDRRADGETADHKQLSAEVFKPVLLPTSNILIPVASFLYFCRLKNAEENVLSDSAEIGNHLYISVMKLLQDSVKVTICYISVNPCQEGCWWNIRNCWALWKVFLRCPKVS